MFSSLVLFSGVGFGGFFFFVWRALVPPLMTPFPYKRDFFLL